MPFKKCEEPLVLNKNTNECVPSAEVKELIEVELEPPKNETDITDPDECRSKGFYYNTMESVCEDWLDCSSLKATAMYKWQLDKDTN